MLTLVRYKRSRKLDVQDKSWTPDKSWTLDKLDGSRACEKAFRYDRITIRSIYDGLWMAHFPCIPAHLSTFAGM
jgi:hypothetical protein